MAQKQNSVPGRKGKPPKRDMTKRTEEFVQFDILDGPCTLFFHRFFKRRMMTVTEQQPYPWFVGGLHRLARMLDVGERWELWALGSFPVWFLLGFYWRPLGLSQYLAGFGEVFLGLYAGWWFVLMVFLDRRLDHMDLQRVKFVRQGRQVIREARMMERREREQNLPQLRERMEQARQRGQARAADTPDEELDEMPVPEAPMPLSGAAPSLDEMLQG